eukprot:3595023-Amphidinium_carterae.2
MDFDTLEDCPQSAGLSNSVWKLDRWHCHIARTRQHGAASAAIEGDLNCQACSLFVGLYSVSQGYAGLAASPLQSRYSLV